MKINQITTDDLRRMKEQEGLILQGCGGEIQEGVDGINGLLTDAGILLNGSRFETVSVFCQGELTNLLFPLEGVELNPGKLAAWRLQTHERFGSTWLSDYVPNNLGGFVQEQESMKPDCPLIGEDGNIFNLIAIASRTLRQNGQQEQAEAMKERIMGGGCKDYSAALRVIADYVNITEKPGQDMSEGEMTFG